MLSASNLANDELRDDPVACVVVELRCLGGALGGLVGFDRLGPPPRDPCLVPALQMRRDS
jgi:hypothetical protein